MAWRTVERAKKYLKVITSKSSFEGSWIGSLPVSNEGQNTEDRQDRHVFTSRKVGYLGGNMAVFAETCQDAKDGETTPVYDETVQHGEKTGHENNDDGKPILGWVDV